MTGSAHGLRVCVVSTSVEFGGAEAYLARLVAGLRDEIDFVALLPVDADARTVAKLDRAGACVELVAGLQRLPSRRGLAGTVRALGRLRPGLVHVNLTDQRDGAIPLLASRLRRLASIATLNLVIPQRDGLRERYGRAVLGQARAVIAVSNAVASYVRSLGLEPRIVRQGLTAPVLRPDARDALGLPADATVVGGIGRLHHQKGWDVLCDATERVRRAFPDARFVVVGDGPERESLAARGAIELVGHRDDAASLVGAFDVLAVPSRYEAFGLVALEAMLSGVPVVATHVGGLVEVVGDAGRLVPPGRPDALADALLDVLDSPAETTRLADVARERARREFAAERMVSETRAIYREFCS